jgi:hypothetical protein
MDPGDVERAIELALQPAAELTAAGPR